MSKRFFIIIFILVAASFQSFFSTYSLRKENSDSDYKKAFMHYNKVFGLVLPAEAEFCNEELPLNIYHVRERLDREITVNSYWHSSTLLLLKKAKRYLKIIEPILKQHNVPDDLKYIAMIESSFKLDVSPRGAAGFWQFMPETARRYGLRVDEDVDERYDIEKSTHAACKVLKYTYNMFGSWTLAAAAYNVGEGRIKNEVEKQKTNNYFHLKLPEETMRYVYRLISAKFIYNNPAQYGFYLRNIDVYPDIPTKTIKVDSTINDLVAFAIDNNTDYMVLYELNPWLKSTKLNNPENITYRIKIPKDEYFDYDKEVDKIKNPNEIFHDTLTTDNL